MIESLWIALAFGFGLCCRWTGLPPLVGFLIAGFVLNYIQQTTGTPLDHGKTLEELAHIGVLLLLFTVGLKLRLRTVIQLEVLGGALVHFTVFSTLCAALVYWSANLLGPSLWVLAAALGFSSTVIAATVLESKRELRAFHGRVAIGILIVQDLIALAILSAGGEQVPSPWAVVVFAIPVVIPLFNKLIDWTGHDELFVLLGLLFALVIGGYGFKALGLSSELGALILGAAVAQHPRSQELGKALWSVKEIFLVGFFLQIGMSGLPDWHTIGIALALTALLPVKMILFFVILILFKLRARSAFLAALSLASFSEFSLIVASGVIPEWTVPLALAVAISFVIAAPLNRISHHLYEKAEAWLPRFELSQRHIDEQPVTLGKAQVVVMGMGRLGTSAYDHLVKRGKRAVGLDADPGKVERHTKAGRRVFYADAEDPGFWHGLRMNDVQAVILSLNDREAKILAARQLRRVGFKGRIVTTSLYDDEAEAIRAAGADHAFLAYSEAGIGLAEHVRDTIGDSDSDPRP